MIKMELSKRVNFPQLLLIVFFLFFLLLPKVTLAQEDLVITATAPADSSDFSNSIIVVSGESSFIQDEEIQFEISYGSSLSTPTGPVTVEAEWTLGTISGFGSPTVEVVDYVVGSATSASGGVAPVVDLVNRTITWTIPSIAPGTTDTIYFKLLTNENYTGNEIVSFDVSSDFSFPGGNILEELNLSYSNTEDEDEDDDDDDEEDDEDEEEEVEVSPSPALEDFIIESVNISSTTFSEIIFYLGLSEAGTIDLYYGVSPGNLDKKIIYFDPKKRHKIILSELLEDTDYYFQFTAKDGNGRSVTSDIYTASTARKSEIPKIIDNSLMGFSNGNILQNPDILNQPSYGTIIIPRLEELKLKFQLDNHKTIKRIRVIIRDSQVLGATTVRAKMLESTEVGAIEISPTWFLTKLLSPRKIGSYDLIAVITDHDGNLVEEKISTLKVVEPITIIDSKTKENIELADVYLYILNYKTGIYELVEPYFFNLNNPTVSLVDGSVPYVLPRGKYKIIVKEPLYTEKFIEFEIGESEDYYLPIIELEKNWSLRGVVSRYIRTVKSYFIDSRKPKYSNPVTSVWKTHYIINAFLLFVYFLTVVNLRKITLFLKLNKTGGLSKRLLIIFSFFIKLSVYFLLFFEIFRHFQLLIHSKELLSLVLMVIYLSQLIVLYKKVKIQSYFQ